MDITQAIQSLSIRYKAIQQKKLDEENTMLENYRIQLPSIVSRYNLARVNNPPVITVPVIFNRKHDENFISDYLSYIIDPQKNGIGTGPLEALLKLCKVDVTEFDLHEAHPYREFPLGAGRIDLLVDCCDTVVLGVENKIFSPEGQSQTINYERELDKLYPDILHPMIFLTREGYQAGSKQFIPVSYTQLFSVFKKVPVDHVTDHRKLSLWEDFLQHLEVYIMGTKPETFEFSDKSRLYIEHYNMFNDLSRTFKNDWAEAISFLDSSLDERLSGGPWEHGFSATKPWQQVWKSTWATSDLYIHFEWILGVDDFLKGRILLFIDIEGKRAAQVLPLFDEPAAKLKRLFDEHDIKYRPKVRTIAIAYKEYSIEQNIDQIVDRFVESFEEFRFLEPVIDDVLAQLSMRR